MSIQNFEHDFLNVLDRYNKLVADLEPFEPWKKKVEEEIGNWIHQIYNNMEESKAKRRVFQKMVNLSPNFRTDKSISSDDQSIL